MSGYIIWIADTGKPITVWQICKGVRAWDKHLIQWFPSPGTRFEQIPFSANMMTSSNENIFRVTGYLYGEFTGDRWIPPHKGQWRGALVFYVSAPE